MNVYRLPFRPCAVKMMPPSSLSSAVATVFLSAIAAVCCRLLPFRAKAHHLLRPAVRRRRHVAEGRSSRLSLA
ncbi:hypothetical protein CBR_g50389 [Chara braunii]|uniref:Uncharacterized protein n=1 Tax=Chara braunii TaxID=69332 RepID=A0A388M6P7_CHABU|nr:hypothetical protein CBR_g50389 [Chara braunii]|eukprot:GBG90210.1 hypothetical protein CBR_g50389 [Chara braunii]